MARFPVMDLQGEGSVRLTLEQRYQTLEAIFVHQYFETYRLIGRRYGWEAANDIALQVPESSIPLIVEGYRRKFGLGGGGARRRDGGPAARGAPRDVDGGRRPALPVRARARLGGAGDQAVREDRAEAVGDARRARLRGRLAPPGHPREH